VLAGLLAPLISCFVTGMPPLYPPMVVVVALEGAVLGGVASAVFRSGRGSRWAALSIAVVAGRAAAAGATWLLAFGFNLPPGLSAAAVLVQGMPGVVLQLVVVPVVVEQLSRRPGTLFRT
jgi:niacin transporter